LYVQGNGVPQNSVGGSRVNVRLATFNLENLGIREFEDTPDARERLPEHLKALRSEIARLDADAVAFQELLEPRLLGPLLEGMGYPHVVVSPRGASPLLAGVFSRHPLSELEQVATSIDFSLVDDKTGMELGVRGPFGRPAFQVTWDVPGFQTTLIVVHWKSKIPSFTPSRSSEPGDPWQSFGDVAEGRLVTEIKRVAQAVQIRRAVDRLLERDPDARVAVLGDYNDTLESEPLRIVRGDAKGCGSPGLIGTELVACGLAIPADLRFTHIYRGQHEMIDHILISRGLLRHFTDARALNESLCDTDDSSPEGSYRIGSDHAPLLADFRV
jgi:hypothetical protein